MFSLHAPPSLHVGVVKENILAEEMFLWKQTDQAHLFKWFYLHTFVSNDLQIFCENVDKQFLLILIYCPAMLQWMGRRLQISVVFPGVIFVQLSSLAADCCSSPGFNHHNHLLKLQEQCWVLLLSDDLQPKLRQFLPSLAAMKPDICCSDIWEADNDITQTESKDFTKK